MVIRHDRMGTVERTTRLKVAPESENLKAETLILSKSDQYFIREGMQ